MVWFITSLAFLAVDTGIDQSKTALCAGLCQQHHLNVGEAPGVYPSQSD